MEKQKLPQASLDGVAPKMLAPLTSYNKSLTLSLNDVAKNAFY